MKKLVQKKDIWLYGYSALFSFVYFLGRYFYEKETLSGVFSGKRGAANLVGSLFLTVAVVWILQGVLFLHNFVIGKMNADGGQWRRLSQFFDGLRGFSQWKRGLAVWIIFFLAWLPCYISYYPGVFSYDTPLQWRMALGEYNVTTHHPPLHTFIIRLCYQFGQNFQAEYAAIVIYSIVQMLLLSWMLSKLVCAMAKRIPGAFLLFMLLFLALNPVIALFSFSITKDVYFAITLIGLFLELLHWTEEEEKGSIWKTALWAVLCCLFRNNFVYAWCIAFLLMLWKLKDWKRFLGMALISVVMTLSITKIVYPAIGVAKGSAAEMLSVPTLQFAYVAKYQGLTDEEYSQMAVYIDPEKIIKNYNPRVSDYVKVYLNDDVYRSDKASFWKLWWKLFQKYPNDFFDTFVSLNLPYWYQGADPNDPYSKRTYIETDWWMDEVEKPESVWPGVQEFYEQFAQMRVYDDCIALKWIYCLATPIWLLLACMVMLLQRGNARYLRVFLPFLFYWLTFLLGPVSNARYIFPFMLFYPVMLGMMFMTKKNQEKIRIDKEKQAV